MEDLVLSEYGYCSVKNLPSQKELEEYYSNKYYQQNAAAHSHEYSKDEVRFFETKAKVAYHLVSKTKTKTLLDVGAGEGYFANYFHKKKWSVTTLDYSDYGIKTHNPDIKHTLIKNDIFDSVKKVIADKKRYSLVNLSNVLEHVIDPVSLLEDLKSLLDEDSLLRISVPNDFSKYQEFLLENKDTTITWVTIPDHLHYFTFDSLQKLLEACGYEVSYKLGEFPIEIFLANDSSNYAKDRSLGKNAHKARVKVDNFLFEQGIEKYIEYYQSSANIGMSRQVVIYAKRIS